MGNSTIDTCRSCGQKQENMYGGGTHHNVLYCEKCGLEKWLTYREEYPRAGPPAIQYS